MEWSIILKTGFDVIVVLIFSVQIPAIQFLSSFFFVRLYFVFLGYLLNFKFGIKQTRWRGRGSGEHWEWKLKWKCLCSYSFCLSICFHFIPILPFCHIFFLNLLYLDSINLILLLVVYSCYCCWSRCHCPLTVTTFSFHRQHN